jgi:CPA1 family monovalent cation:H+ antiporter
VWSLIEYILEGFVFLLIGQQLPDVIDGVQRYPTGSAAAAAGVTIGAILVIRYVWLIGSELLPAQLHTRLGAEGGHQHTHLSGRDVVALGWAGTRGVITLAAAFSVPLTTHKGTPLGGRDLVLFSAYVAVLVTLVGQGITFAPLLRRLNFRESAADEALTRNEARSAAVRAALRRLDELAVGDVMAQQVAALRGSAAARLERYEARAEWLSSMDDDVPPDTDPYVVAVRLRREMIAAEREELLHWRDTGRLSDRNLQMLQRELDHEEGMLPPR